MSTHCFQAACQEPMPFSEFLRMLEEFARAGQGREIIGQLLNYSRIQHAPGVQKEDGQKLVQFLKGLGYESNITSENLLRTAMGQVMLDLETSGYISETTCIFLKAGCHSVKAEGISP